MSHSTKTWLLLAILALIAINVPRVSSQSCRASYDRGSSGKPLLFGGVASKCKSGCQSRSDEWSERCSGTSGSWGLCSKEQAQKSLEAAMTLGGATKLSPCDLMPYLQGRTTWIIGDSHSKSMYRALQCFLIDFWSHTECEASANARDVQQLYNLPAAVGQSKCFHLFGGGRVCFVHVALGSSLINNNQVANGGVLPLLRAKFAQPKDIFYLSFGSWHKKKPEWWQAYRPTLTALGQYYQSTKSQWPHLLFRESPATHKPDTSQSYCTAAQGLLYKPQTGRLEFAPAAKVSGMMLYELGATTNKIASEVLSSYSIPIVPGFNISVPLHSNHVGKYGSDPLDCMHYCHPGVPEMWVWYLYSAMRSGQAGIKPLGDSSIQQEAARAYKCVPSYTARFRY